jgi:Asp-tRNA(Asn)/Glu-tRNA(Gln) amidotransferase A subunit family amidase
VDPTSLPATRLAEAIAAAELSSAEVVEAHLRRIEEVDPRVNAVVQVDGDRALAAAREADASSAPPGPLHGVPFTVKDNLEAAGIEMAIGAEERVGTVPGADATVVARMRAAGAILLGKTNCPEYGGGIETDNAVYGRTNNPVRPRSHAGRQLRRRGRGDRGRLLALRPRHRLGRERAPARPLLRPRRAQADLRPRPRHRRDRRPRPDRRARRPAHPGRHPRPLGARRRAHPRARQRPRRRRRRRPARPADGARRRRPARPACRGPDRQRLDTPTPETVAAVEAAAQALAAAGAQVEPASPPGGGHELTIDVWRSYGDPSDLYDILRRWDGYRSEMLAWFAAYDLVLCPVFPDPARAHGDMNRPGERDPTSYTTPTASPAGPPRPCAAAPPGGPADRRPARRPPVARRHRPRRGEEIERAHGGRRPPPL